MNVELFVVITESVHVPLFKHGYCEHGRESILQAEPLKYVIQAHAYIWVTKSSWQIPRDEQLVKQPVRSLVWDERIFINAATFWIWKLITELSVVKLLDVAKLLGVIVTADTVEFIIWHFWFLDLEKINKRITRVC